jgi:hypothetical protein
VLTTASQTKLPLIAKAAARIAKNRIELAGVSKRAWTRPNQAGKSLRLARA